MAGKLKNKNAMKHGLYSRETILPGEHEREYNELVSEMMEEWSPEGPTEMMLVEELVSLTWKYRRLRRLEAASLKAQVDRNQDHNEAMEILEDLERLQPAFAAATTAREVERLFKKNKTSVEIILQHGPKQTEDPSLWGPAIAEFVNKLSEFKDRGRIEGFGEMATYTDSERIEVQEDRMQRLSDRISSTIKRLVQTKATKQMMPRRSPMLVVQAANGAHASREEIAADERAKDGKAANQNFQIVGPRP